MPDNYTAVGAQSAAPNPSDSAAQRAAEVAGGPVYPTDVLQNPTANDPMEAAVTTLATSLQGRQQLTENSGPFKVDQQAQPAVEYVPITEPLPITTAPMNQPQPLSASPAPYQQSPSQPSVRPVPSSAPQPTATMAAPAVLSEQPSFASQATPTLAPTPESTAQPLAPRQLVASQPATPVAMPSLQPTAASMQSEPAPEATQPSDTSSVVAQEAVPVVAKPHTIFSNSSSAISKARRSIKVLYILAFLGTGIVLMGLLFYWYSIGTPTHLQDLPFINH